MNKISTDHSYSNVIVVAILLLVSNDTLLFGTNINNYFFFFHIVLLFMLFLYMIKRNVLKINKKNVFIGIILSTVYLLTMAYNLDLQIMKYIYSIFLVMLSVLIANYIKLSVFINSYNKILYVLSWFSIILFIIGFFYVPILEFFPYIINEAGFKFYFLGIGFLEQLNYTKIPRLYSFFREPGVYACFLNLAVLFELFYYKKLNFCRIIIDLIACLLTFSTAAYVLLFCIVTLFFIKCITIDKVNKNNNIVILTLIILLIILLGSFILDYNYIMRIVFNKFFIDNSSRDSRYASIFANYKMFLNNPFLGNGWSFVENKFSYYVYQGVYFGIHNTNTFFKLLAVYGIIPVFILFLGTISFFYQICKRKFLCILLTFLWVVNLSSEDLCFNILVYLISIYGLSSIRLK